MTLTQTPLEDRTIVGALRRAVDAAPDRIFIRDASRCVSYGDFDRRACAVANGLTRLGVERFGKVALMMKNSMEFVESWLGAAKCGALYVPLNTAYKGDILEYQLNRADVTHMVVDSESARHLSEIQSNLPKLRTVVIVGEDVGGVGRSFDAHVQVIPYGELVDGPATDPHVPVAYTDPHAISFTSGTTGPSKGVLATHCHTVTFALDWIEACGVDGSDRLYTCLPMFHAIATWLGVLPALLVKTEIAFAERFSATRFWDDVRRFDATVVHGIFSMIPMLLKHPARPDDAEVPARLFYIGQRNAEFERRFNCRIIEVYGATETGIVTYTPLAEEGVAGSCGRANARSYEVAVVDEFDQPVRVGDVGEIVVRPRQPYSMFNEYYGMAAETVAALRNLWFHTGDNASVDAEGYLKFADRKKDAIRRRGENISSFELEKVLLTDDRVLECAAVAVPSDLGEDEVKLVIVTQTGKSLTAEEVWNLCERRMPRFWIPRFLEFREELPKTPNGKTQKYLLRAQHRSGIFDREAGNSAQPRSG